MNLDTKHDPSPTDKDADQPVESTPEPSPAESSRPVAPPTTLDEAIKLAVLEPVQQMLSRMEQRLDAGLPSAPSPDDEPPPASGSPDDSVVSPALARIEEGVQQVLTTMAEPTDVADDGADAAAVKEQVEAIDRIGKTLAGIESRLANIEALPRLTIKELEAVGKSLVRNLNEVGNGVIKHVTKDTKQSLAEFQLFVAQRFDMIDSTLAPEEPEEPEEESTGSADWERTVLGESLYEDAALVDERHDLIEGVLSGQEGARALVGELLLMQSAAPDDLTQRAKAVGEAYYRWRPKAEEASPPMEQALVAMLEQSFDAASIRNRIELVRPGDQYDRLRHNGNGRGVAITTVRGWVVLRENGKPATKANVDVE